MYFTSTQYHLLSVFVMFISLEEINSEVVVITNHSFTALVAVLWFTEKINVHPGWLVISYRLLEGIIGDEC